MAKKDWKNYIPWVVFIALITTAIDILMRLLGYTPSTATILTFIEGITLVVGFIGFVLLIYKINEFKFKTMLNLGIFALVILSLIVANFLLVPPMIGIVSAVYSGFSPLMTGFIVGGIISIVMGLTRLESTMKRGRR